MIKKRRRDLSIAQHLIEQQLRCTQQRSGQEKGGQNGNEPADQQNKRDGNGDRLDAVIASLILIVLGAAQ